MKGKLFRVNSELHRKCGHQEKPMRHGWTLSKAILRDARSLLSLALSKQKTCEERLVTKAIATRSKKLLVAPGMITRNKRTLLVTSC